MQLACSRTVVFRVQSCTILQGVASLSPSAKCSHCSRQLHTNDGPSTTVVSRWLLQKGLCGFFVLQVLLEVARSIQHLHSMQLIHCDVKAENVLLKSNNASATGFTCKVRMTAACPSIACFLAPHPCQLLVLAACVACSAHYIPAYNC